MKKITSLLLVLMMLVSLLSLSAFAAPEGLNEDTATLVKELVLKGTPEIDGKLDAMYTESLTVKLHGPASSYYIAGGSCEDTTATGTVYAMYDDNYVYVFFHVVDETLIQADPDYILYSDHPHLSDAVEVRVGDDLEEHFAPYDGSNDAHHLFYADAHGTRFSCYEDSMGDDVDKLKSASMIAADGKTYYVELAIPTQKAFKEGEIIEFEFQIDDLQDDLDSMCAVGTGIPHNLIQFKIGGNTSGAKDTATTPTTPTEPEVTTPTEPEVTTPTEPEVTTPTEPEVTTPTEPEVTTPTEPEVTTPEVTDPEVTDPEVTDPEVTDPEVTDPEVTDPETTDPEVTDPETTDPEVTDPEVTDPEVTDPEVTDPEVTDPEVTDPETTDPETPATSEPTTPEAPAEEEKSNTGLIIGIIAAVVVIAAIVVVALKKKK